MRQLPLLSVTAALAVPLLLAAASAAAPDAAPAKPPAPAAGAAAAPAGEKVVGPPEVAWKDMTKEQKGKYMKAVVNPKMKVAFQKYDPEEFKKFGCATCHGKEAKAKEFKMPNPDIHPLPGTPEAFQAMMKQKPSWEKWTKFMSGEVVPQMAAMLGKPAFDFKKPDPAAFSCQACHTLKKS
jgi:hypothetical protein